MKLGVRERLRLFWNMGDPGWILLPMLGVGIVVIAGLVWFGLSVSDRAPMGDPVTVHGTVDRFSIRLGKYSRVGLAQVTVEGRTHYFTLSIAADCRRGDRFEVSKRSRPLKSPVFYPASGQPCRRP